MSLLQRALLKRHEDNRANPHVVTAAQAAYDSAVSGFAPTTAAAALDSLAAVRIVEVGENENGTYVRWENGLQVCWVPSIELVYNTINMLRSTWTYPAGFEPDTTIACNATPNEYCPVPAGRAAGTVVICEASSARIAASIAGDVFTEANVWKFQACAIGRWKS